MAYAPPPPDDKQEIAVESSTDTVEMPSLETRIQWYNDWEESTRDSRELAIRDRQYLDNFRSEIAVESSTDTVEMPSLETRVQWYNDWEESTRDSRELAIRDRQYLDNVQWTDEEIKTLEERGQPVTTKNRIARKVNFILGEEIKKRIDPVARPRTPQHEDAANAATDALRFVEEEQEFDQARSAVFKNMLVEGFGGAIKEIDEEDDYKHVLRHVEWDRLFYDPHSRKQDFTDAKYLGIVTWSDLDDAILDYPDAADALQAAVAKDNYSPNDTTDDEPRRWVDSKRKRVKICELYFRVGKNYYRSDFTGTT